MKLNVMMTPFLITLSCFGIVAGASPTTEIKIDQVGYLPEAPKFAFVVSSSPASEFIVRRKRDNSIAFRGKLSEPVNDPDTNDQVQAADFSNLKAHGAYYLDVPGVGRSWSFVIGSDVYLRAFFLSLRFFYGQRCGTAVDLGPDFPRYKHAACHLNGAFHPSSGKSGAYLSRHGWHDAGDYGRYVVNSGISTGELLWTWELFGRHIMHVKLNIPESRNNTPDILDEIRWNLDWMLTMQDDDGGVWHKQTSEDFAPLFVMPEDDKLPSYVIGTGKDPYKSSCATADFAAVMAIAARVYKPFDAKFADTCLQAAEKAWVWVQKYPAVTFSNPNNVITGGYGDNDCRDEILWAAAELWRTTRKDAFERYFLDHFSEQLPTIRAVGPPTWPQVGPFGLWTYVLGGGTNRNAADTIQQASIKAADEIVERSIKNAYRISMTTRDFVWGSNGVAANYGVQLLVANAMKPDVRYKQTAAENLHYLLGRNTFSLSWVTQVGEHPFRNPHHNPSLADSNAEPWPGMLSGGPNQRRQDPAMEKLGNLPPAKMYVDDLESYATNEVAINWNAPLVFVLAGLLPEK
jgi:endoglucanase